MTAKTLVNFPTLSSRASTEDEINYMKALRLSVDAGTFMASFLSPQAEQWFIAQVKNDFATDLMHEYEYQCQQNIAARSDLAQAESRIKAKDLEIDVLREQVQMAKNETEQVREQLGERVLEAASMRCKIEEIIQGKDDLRDASEQVIAALDRKIMELKARCYDLEHPQG